MLAFEACLIEQLPALFCPEDVLDMDDEVVANLAAEEEDMVVERNRCSEKLRVLENGLKELKNLQGVSRPRYAGKDEI